MGFWTFVKEAIFPLVTVGGLLYIGKKLQILDNLDKAVNMLKHNTQIISNALIGSDVEFDHGRLRSCSPLQLTEKGEEFLDEIGFKTLFEHNSEDFLNFIKNENPQTDYDIENASIKSVFFLFDNPYFKDVKEYLYNNPKEDKKELMNVAGIYVRDHYLERKDVSSKKS